MKCPKCDTWMDVRYDMDAHECPKCGEVITRMDIRSGTHGTVERLSKIGKESPDGS